MRTDHFLLQTKIITRRSKVKKLIDTQSIQVNGKLRGNIEVSHDIDEKTLISNASDINSVKKYLEGKEIVKKIVVPGRLVNFVVR